MTAHADRDKKADATTRYRLTITAGSGLVGTTLALSPDREATIGCGERCSLVVPSSRVAPTHCRLRYEDGEWMLRCEEQPLGEPCVVIANDGRCSEMPLCHGDRIEVGGYRLRFEDATQADDDFSEWLPPITLVVRSGPALPDPRLTALSAETVLIGHSDTALWQLPDRTVSRHHCRIETDGDGWIVRDLGSKNGTYLNGERVSRGRLRHDTRLGIG
ncbi:unnamed protein product, partial [marine sediment metagenome]